MLFHALYAPQSAAYFEQATSQFQEASGVDPKTGKPRKIEKKYPQLTDAENVFILTDEGPSSTELAFAPTGLSLRARF